MSQNWRGVAVQRLRDYPLRLEAVDNITEQLEMLEDRFTAIRSATTDGTPVQGGNENRREEMLIHNISMRDELKANLEFVEREIELTLKGLQALTEREKTILTEFYINGTRGHLEKLCDDLYVSKTELYRQKDTALKKFTIAMYGIVEL